MQPARPHNPAARWRSHYSPSTHYPNYIGWYVVMGDRPTRQALNWQDQTSHTAVHHV